MLITEISAIRPVTFPLAALPEAPEAAAKVSNLECVVVYSRSDPVATERSPCHLRDLYWLGFVSDTG